MHNSASSSTLTQLTLRRSRRTPLDPLPTRNLLLPDSNIMQRLTSNRLIRMTLRMRRRPILNRTVLAREFLLGLCNFVQRR